MGQTSRRRRYSDEEVAQRGDEIHERVVVPHLKAEDKGKIVAIDVETEEWEMDKHELAASDRLYARRPDAEIWLRRVGFPYVHRFRSPRLLRDHEAWLDAWKRRSNEPGDESPG